MVKKDVSLYSTDVSEEMYYALLYYGTEPVVLSWACAYHFSHLPEETLYPGSDLA